MGWYNFTLNVTDIFNFANDTVSEICIDPLQASTCGAFIFGNGFLLIFGLFLFAGFRRRTDIVGATAGASFLVSIFATVFLVFRWISLSTLIGCFVVLFFSVIAIWTRKKPIDYT